MAQQADPKPLDVMAGEPVEASRGLSKFGWFSALNISMRNCSFHFSLIGKVLINPKSRFQYDGAVKILRPAPLVPGGGKQKLSRLTEAFNPQVYG